MRDDLGVDDPYDCGIFSLKEEKGKHHNKWAVDLKLDALSIDYTARMQDVHLKLAIKGLEMTEAHLVIEKERFPFIFRTGSTFKMDYKAIKREASNYKNEDMLVELDFGVMYLNWKPIQMNRFLRFFRFFKFKHEAADQ